MILQTVVRHALLVAICLLSPVPVHAGDIQAAVDARVEFLSAVARNAGFEEYRMPNAQSPYAQRVDDLLAPQRSHPAFDAMRAMRRDHGLSYDVQVLSREADRLADAAARAPKLLSSTPTAGSQDIPSGPFTLVLVFDRPMRTDSYSIVGSAQDVPTGFKVGKVGDDGKTWEFNGSCEPGHTYTIGLNGDRFRGFKSKDGVELEPVTLRFTTRAK